MVTTITYPSAPTLTKRNGTLLDAATVVDSGTSWLSDNEALFESFNCMDFGSSAVWCGPNAKTFSNSPGWSPGFRFAAYGGVTCRSVGFDQSSAESGTRAAFEVGESTAVERALMKTRFVALAGKWAVPTDITPAGGAVSVQAGIGLLEGYAGTKYAGAPTLHLPRVVVPMLNGTNSLSLEGGTLVTQLGSKVAAGAGYDFPNTGPTGAAAAAGERWLYATGEVLILRDDLVVQQELNRSTNDVVVLAERMYFAVVDCFTAAVKVKVA
jgi:hypothetical protein